VGATSEDGIATLLAREEIRQQLRNYCRGMDRADKDLVRSVWHADGTLDYALPGVGTPEQLIDHSWAYHAKQDVLLHRVLQVTIELEGTRAASEAYVLCGLYRQLDEGRMREMFAYARYLDRWSRREGRWAIDHRHAILDLGGTRDIEGRFLPRHGRKDISDPSYGFFADFRRGPDGGSAA